MTRVSERIEELARELAEAVCHDEQMTIWTDDLAMALSLGGFFRDDLTYDDVLKLHAIIGQEIRHLIASAFDHPEALTALRGRESVIEECARIADSYSRGDDDFAELTSRIRSLSSTSQVMEGMSAAAQDVLAERRRQIEAEGWTPEHDDEHDDGSLADAAATYALLASGWSKEQAFGVWPPTWSQKWLKVGDPRRMLVKACALGIAEIERLDRAMIKAAGGGDE